VEAKSWPAVAVGYQGFGNLGDEAILAGIEVLLAPTPIRVVCVLGGDRAAIPAFPTARRIVSRRLLPGPRSIGAVARSRLILVSGGGLLNDHYAPVVPRYLAWACLARLLGKRVVWVGVGVGPLRRRVFRWLAGLALRVSNMVLVRDESSASLARAIGGRVDGVMPDPALFLDPPAGILPEDRLAVVVRAPTRERSSLTQQLGDALAGLIARDPRPATVYTFAGERDRDFARSVVDAAVRLGAARTSYEALGPDPYTGLSRLAAASAVVSVRLHGMLLAAIAGRPVVAVGYDDKVFSLAAELGAASCVVPLAEVTADRLAATLAVAESDPERERVAAHVSALRVRRAEVAATLVEPFA
jgi:polysaccharide pyruvyl transferase CsaB